MELIIFNQDCVLGMKEQIEDKSIDVIVTSPPYNLNIKYNIYKDSKTPAEYFNWCHEWIQEFVRCLKDDGSLFLNLGAISTNPFFAFDVARIVGKYLDLQNTIHWIKSISIPSSENGVISRGHFKPINSKRYVNNCHEYIFHFTKNGDVCLDRKAVGVPYAHKGNINRWENNQGIDKRCRGNTWFIPYETINNQIKDRPHPATFPSELAKNCILLHGNKNCVVLDPFLGIGSSGVGAKESGIVNRFIGFEIDQQYSEFSKDRLKIQSAEGRNKT